VKIENDANILDGIWKGSARTMQSNENKRNNVAYRIGQGLAFVVALCLGAITIALTVKFILWIL
jgi:hypothetical protein